MNARTLAGIVVLAAAGAACRGTVGQPEGYAIATGGDAERGRELITRYDCGVCHRIPGVRAARGLLAPPLDAFARRSFIAGEVPNTPENLVRWVRDPRSIESRTAMPAVGLGEQDARDVAAYLYTLR